jgi:hypothetical protein
MSDECYDAVNRKLCVVVLSTVMAMNDECYQTFLLHLAGLKRVDHIELPESLNEEML